MLDCVKNENILEWKPTQVGIKIYNTEGDEKDVFFDL
jgi:hypothetical protein